MPGGRGLLLQGALSSSVEAAAAQRTPAWLWRHQSTALCKGLGSPSMAPRAGVDDALKDMKLSGEEADRLAKAFKDPKFMKLFQDYAREISDVEAKNENDAYLRQLEAEGADEQMFGTGTQLVAPQPGWALKTQPADSSRSGAAVSGSGKDDEQGCRVYINVCSSDKVAPVRERPHEQGGRPGVFVEIPICMGVEQRERCKQGGPLLRGWNAVVHPSALERAAVSAPFRETLIESVLERVEAAAGVPLVRRPKLLGTKYKSLAGEAGPRVMALRVDGGGAAPGGQDKPTGVGAAQWPADKAGQQPPQQQQQQQPGQAGSAQGRSAFSFGQPRKQLVTELPQQPQRQAQKQPGGEVEPEWRLVHRGQVDLGDAWGDAGRVLGAASSRPKELVLHTSLPGVSSVGAVQLDIPAGGESLSLRVVGRYWLELPLPHPVLEERGRARFDCVKQALEVVLPVRPPEPPPAPAPVTAAAAGDEAAGAAGDGGEADASASSDAAAGMKEGQQQEQQQDEQKQQSSSREGEGGPTKTQNELLWEQLHSSEAKDIRDKPASPAPQQQHAQACKDAPEQQGGEQGAAALPAAPAPPPLLLQPRLRCTLATDID